MLFCAKPTNSISNDWIHPIHSRKSKISAVSVPQKSQKFEMVVKSEDDIDLARKKAKSIAEKIGFRYMDLNRIATAVSELARNAVKFAGQGNITIRELKKPPNRKIGIEISIVDEGPGIENLDLALQGGYSTSGGLGLGLSGSRRLMDEFDIDTKPGKGTKIVIRKYL